VVSVAVMLGMFGTGCASAIRTNISTFQNPGPVPAPDGGTATIIVGKTQAKGAPRTMSVNFAIDKQWSKDPILDRLGRVEIKKINGIDVSDLFIATAREPANPQLDVFWTITAIDIPAGTHELSVSADGEIHNGKFWVEWGPALYTFSHDFQPGRTYLILADVTPFKVSNPLGIIFLGPSELTSYKVKWLLTEKLPPCYPAAIQHRRQTGNNVYEPVEKNAQLEVRMRDCFFLGDGIYNNKDGLPTGMTFEEEEAE